MTTITVWRFDSPSGADGAGLVLERLADEGLVTIVGAASVSWPRDAGVPTCHPLDTTPIEAFWDLLFGVLFAVPLRATSVTAAIGALGGALAEAGVDDRFTDEVRAKVTPGGSALFVLATDVAGQRARDALHGVGAELVRTGRRPQEVGSRPVFVDS